MPGPVRADGLFFACAKSKAKSTHKGKPLMYPPEGCPPLAGRKGHACQCPPRPVFCPDRAYSLAPGCAAKPHYTVPDRAGPVSLPGRGTRGGVADPSPVRRILPERRAQARFGLKAREAMGVVLVGIPKQHAPHPPYGTPGRVPAFGWAEKTRMSVPAPSCFSSRRAPPTRPGLRRKTPLHSARSDWRTRLAGEGHTGRGHCPLARKAN